MRPNGVHDGQQKPCRKRPPVDLDLNRSLGFRHPQFVGGIRAKPLPLDGLADSHIFEVKPFSLLPQGEKGRSRTSSNGPQYRFRRLTRMLKHIGVPIPQHLNPLRPKPRVPRRVIGAVRVLAAITLDDHAWIEAYKIGDIGPQRRLPPELQPSELATTEQAPKPPLGGCLVMAHGAGAVSQFVPVRHADEAGTPPRPAKPLILPLALLAGPSFSRKGRRVGRTTSKMCASPRHPPTGRALRATPRPCSNTPKEQRNAQDEAL